MVFLCSLLIIIALCNLILANPAHAYLDPNAGGLFLQVVIPFVFAAAAAITIFWRRLIRSIKNVINRLLGRNSSQSIDD